MSETIFSKIAREIAMEKMAVVTSDKKYDRFWKHYDTMADVKSKNYSPTVRGIESGTPFVDDQIQKFREFRKPFKPGLDPNTGLSQAGKSFFKADAAPSISNLGKKPGMFKRLARKLFTRGKA